MFTFFRTLLRNRAVTSLIEAEREYGQARRRYRRAVRLLASKASWPLLGKADEVIRDLALARAQHSAEQLLTAHARCESLRDARPVAPALPAR